MPACTGCPAAASIGGSKSSNKGRAVAPLDLRDYTQGGSPPALLVEARNVLEGGLQSIQPLHDSWLPLREFLVITDRGERGLFLEKGDAYVRLNSGAELTGINDALRGFRFTREDFDKPSVVCKFLMAMMFFHKGSGRVPCSTFAIEGLVHYPSEWLKGTQQTEASLRALCHEPVFVFDGDKWQTTFKAFRPDGGLDQWTLVGIHDPQASFNRILRIDVADAVPAGAFHYPFFD